MTKKLQTIRLADYLPPAFCVAHHELTFSLNDNVVTVTHRQQFSKNTAADAPKSNALVLNGEDLVLKEVRLDGELLPASRYAYADNLLTVRDVPAQFELQTVVEICPEKNFQLAGLYRSNGVYCTQCEAEGFRRISFALDRPDVLATYRVRIEGSKADNPVMLSNGNLEDAGDLADGRAFTQWFDPHPKPSYLFALVAGKLAHVQKNITTPHGKKVDLRIYTEPKFIAQTDFAMQSLEQAFAWDEKRFGLSYDLDRFNLVAISDFNMGAMENKSLNVFNTKYVIADTETATDNDFRGVQDVIGHEYFHNWTGDRITCRNWFQLSLKEGLTVFRDQEFASDMNERNIERIDRVNVLRRVQFAEDASPMRHPVQPQEYAAIDNFYTATVYEKGAEVIRMYHTIIGEEGFQKGMKLYVSRHDGEAVRIEEFAQCMEDASGFPFTKHFFDWYTTSGTPKLSFTSQYDAENKTFTLTAAQDIMAVTPQHALLIPIKIALLKADGSCYQFASGETSKLLLLEKEEEHWTFGGVDEALTPVLLEGFSAPVYYDYDFSNADLQRIVRHAPDGFARYEAMQILLRRLFLAACDNSATFASDVTAAASLMREVLANDTRTPWEKAMLLSIPALPALLPYLDAPIDMDKVIAGYTQLDNAITTAMQPAWADYLAADKVATKAKYSVTDAGIRALRGVAMEALGKADDAAQRQALFSAYEDAQNMTERMHAMNALMQRADSYREQALAAFYQTFTDQPLVIDKWFMLQAKEHGKGALPRIEKLAEHAAFSVRNPNRFRVLVGAFMSTNPQEFHRADGAGYRFVIGQVRRLLIDNPQIAARMLGGFAAVARLDSARKALAAQELKPLLDVAGLSVDVREVVERILSGLE